MSLIMVYWAKKNYGFTSIKDGLIIFIPDRCIFKTNVEKTFVLSKFLKKIINQKRRKLPSSFFDL
jgi:hypothetical protein